MSKIRISVPKKTRHGQLSLPMNLDKKHILSVDEMLGLVLPDPIRKTYRGFGLYIASRFPEPGSGGVSLHIGSRASRLPLLDALNGCRVVISEISQGALDLQEELFSKLRRDIDAAGGGLETRFGPMEKILDGLNNEVNHITSRNMFNSSEYQGDAIQDCKLMLNAIKSGGTILVDSDESSGPHKHRPSGETTLRKAVEQTRGIRIVEIEKFRLPGSGGDFCRLFRVEKRSSAG